MVRAGQGMDVLPRNPYQYQTCHAHSDVPSEVFADDIEALLEHLEGVSSARVVANNAGDIDSIYVTAAADRDESAVRRMVASALISRYSLVVDGWRIRVARLRTSEPAQLWRVQRVEEVVAGSGVRVTVALAAGDEDRPLVGHARALTDRANRLRGAALATLDALKPVFDAEGRRATLDSLSSVPLTGGAAVVVGVHLATATDAELVVGSAMLEDQEAEAVIAATLDAVGKRGATPERRGWMMKDRRDELESMRAHYRRLREPQREMPSLAPDANGDDTARDADAAPIRPERVGGAAPASEPAPPERARATDPAQARVAGKGTMEDEYFRHLVTTGHPVHIRCRDGYEIAGAVVKDFGTYSLLVESDSGRELVFKHGIISIRPLQAANHLKS